MVPGLTDAHYHFLGVGARELTFNLDTKSLQDLLAQVKERAAAANPGEWIVGRGWIETFWNPPVFPTRSDLDKVSPNNPVILGRADGHGAVVNSAALKVAGIDRNTPNPFGGEISKDKNGEPNGMLLDHAQGLVRSKVPPEAAGDPEKAAVAADHRSIMLGWCEVQDPGGTWNDVDVYRKLYQQGKLKVRIYKLSLVPVRKPTACCGKARRLACSTTISRCAPSRWCPMARWDRVERPCWPPTPINRIPPAFLR